MTTLLAELELHIGKWAHGAVSACHMLPERRGSVDVALDAELLARVEGTTAAKK